MGNTAWTVDDTGLVGGLPFHDATLTDLRASSTTGVLTLTYRTPEGAAITLEASIAALYLHGSVVGATIFDILFIPLAERAKLSRHGYEVAALFPQLMPDEIERMAADGLYVGVIDCIDDAAIAFIAPTFSVRRSPELV